MGGGGKSSLMIALAQELKEMGKKIITTTTTKVWHDEAKRADYVLLIGNSSKWSAELSDAIKRYNHIFLGDTLTEEGKVKGLDKDIINELDTMPEIDLLIVEADGAKGRPLKANDIHEPQIPSSSTMVIAVMGADAMGKKLDDATVLRKEQFSLITGVKQEMIIDPSAIISLIIHPSGLFKGAPDGSKKVVFIN